MPLFLLIRHCKNRLELLRKSKVGQACSLIIFDDMSCGGLKSRPTCARGLLYKNMQNGTQIKQTISPLTMKIELQTKRMS